MAYQYEHYDQYRPPLSGRRPSFHGPSHSDQYQYNEPFPSAGSFQEVRPPPGPPPRTASGPHPDALPPHLPQPFPSHGGFNQSFPQPMPPPMHQPYSAPRERRSFSPEPFSAPPPPKFEPTGPPPHRPEYPSSLEDSPLSDNSNYFPPVDAPQMLEHTRSRTHSTGAYHGHSQLPPPPSMTMPPAPPMTPFPSQYGGKPRARRSSTSAVPMYHSAALSVIQPPMESYRMGTGRSVKFRVKGSYRKGISLAEATANVRLSSTYEYSFRELSLDSRGRMHLQVQWPGYRPLNYEIPVTGYEGMVSMSSLARRLSRAIGHFCQANRITIPWDRIVLQRLDETQLGTWAPTIATI